MILHFAAIHYERTRQCLDQQELKNVPSDELRYGVSGDQVILEISAMVLKLSTSQDCLGDQESSKRLRCPKSEGKTKRTS